jgi:ATP-dependent DNA helicase RecG
LAAHGFLRVEQLALLLPRRYDDAGALASIAALAGGEQAYVEGVVVRAALRRFFRRATLEVTIEDAGARLRLRWFRFRGDVPARFKIGARVRAAGRVRLGKQGLEMAQPIAEAADATTRLGGEISLRARYPAITGVSGALMSTLCQLAARARLPEPRGVPALPTLSASARLIHLCDPPDERTREALVSGQAPALQRYAFEALLRVRLRARRAASDRSRPAFILERDAAATLAPIFAALSYAPTAAQRREVAAIAQALASGAPLRRLLTGDVGSGKTLVAVAAIELACASGARCVLLAPTALLAEQQAQVVAAQLRATKRRVVLLHGGLPARERARFTTALADPAALIDVVVGTHALLDEALVIARLGLVVIDEQQRFGVAARAVLFDKITSARPHELQLSATPIPRTLALALRGELDVGHLDERPAGRGPIATQLVADREAALAELSATLARGEKAYWICPQIEGEVGGVRETAAWLEAQLGRAVLVCHGRQTPAARASVMRSFRGATQLLCATTVVEVGLDVPEATLMIIEAPERLGLASLHQLRGRVGRGGRPGRCLLMEGSDSTRVGLLVEIDDGRALAEADLERRGVGELDGARQSGFGSLPPLSREVLTQLVEDADVAAEEILGVDPELMEAGHARLRRGLAETEARRYPDVA